MLAFLSLVYRFKPLRTSAQTLVGFLGAASLISDVAWEVALSGSALAGLVAFLHIWVEGGEMFGEDRRVTDTLTYVGEHREQ